MCQTIVAHYIWGVLKYQLSSVEQADFVAVSQSARFFFGRRLVQQDEIVHRRKGEFYTTTFRYVLIPVLLLLSYLHRPHFQKEVRDDVLRGRVPRSQAQTSCRELVARNPGI